jgi:hypothetical protein
MMKSQKAAANIAKCPDLCAVYLGSAKPGERIGLIKRGETGYYQCDYDSDRASNETARAMADHINARLGVTEAQALAMAIGSMCGWDVPGADPDRHAGADRKQQEGAAS